MGAFQKLFRVGVLGLALSCCVSAHGYAQATTPPVVVATQPVAPVQGQSLAVYLGALAQLEQLGITGSEQTRLLTKLEQSQLEQLSRGEQPTWLPYLRLEYARPQLLDRYLAQQATTPEWSAEEVVTWVNIGLDTPFYQDVQPVSDPTSLQMLVNKYHSLPKDYVPQLVTMSTAYSARYGAQMHPEAYQAFVRMADAAAEEGFRLVNVSAYRSYNTQSRVYQNYVATDGLANAETYSARPGFSEHQTGLAVDINVASQSANFQNTETYAWLKANCTRYGFLLRYPQGKESITGYTFEPWHYRYVGEEAALVCEAQGLTYDEYIARQPVDGPYTAPTLYQGSEPLSLNTVLVDGLLYAPAAEVMETLGWVAVEQEDGTFLLWGKDTWLEYSRDDIVMDDGVPIPTHLPLFWQGDTAMAPVALLADALGVECAADSQGGLHFPDAQAALTRINTLRDWLSGPGSGQLAQWRESLTPIAMSQGAAAILNPLLFQP